jgi:exopolysaccharide biosynthesis WecB/TagA/CpsF family protein
MSIDLRGAQQRRTQSYTDAADQLGNWLLERLDQPTVTTVTWLNHYSAQVALRECPEQLRAFDVIGVDGILLRRLVKAPSRTSADLLLPRLLPRLRGARVLIIGGPPDALIETVECVDEMLDNGSMVVAALDGYQDVSGDATLDEIVMTAKPDFVIVGMGAPRQEIVAQQVARMLKHGVVLTCGGFLDQMRHGSYYPFWAYPLRLNWLVRLTREPMRLWRRYTVQAVAAFRRRNSLREQLWSLAGFSTLEVTTEAVVATATAGVEPRSSEPDLVIDITDKAMARRRGADVGYVLDLSADAVDPRVSAESNPR